MTETEQEQMEDLKKAHGILHVAMESVLECGKLRFIGSADTAFALGEAVGTLSKAKALIGRDCDELLARAQSTSSEPAPL